MNTRVKVLLVLASFFCLYWLLRPGGGEAEVIQDEVPVSVDSARRVIQKKLGKEIFLDDEGMEKPEGLPDEHWQRYLTMYAIKKSANKDVSFYGRAIDQHGDPVVAMKIKFELLGYQTSLAEYSKGKRQVIKKFSVHSDENGYFMVESQRGISLTIEKMEKEGYTRASRGVSHSFAYSSLISGEGSSMYHFPDSQNPIVFKMWKKGVTEPIIKKTGRLRVRADEGQVEAYYAFKLKSQSHPSPPEEWDIKLSGKHGGLHNWEYTLTAVDGGGLQITDELYTNLAPSEGYQKSITFRSSDIDFFAKNKIKKVYYRGPNGNKYATFTYTVSFGGRKPGGNFGISILDLRINPNGSRNLEYDPEKEIRIDNWAR